MRKILGFMLCTLLFLTGCVFDTNNDKVKIQTYTSYNDKFVVEVNKEWKSVEKGTLNDSADIELADLNDEKYFLAIMESKEDFTWTYEEYRDHMFEVDAQIYGATVEDMQDIKIGEYDCNFIEFNPNLEDSALKFYMQIYIIETDNYYGQLLTWTLNSKKDEYRNEFLEIVKTFKQVKDMKILSKVA